MTRLRVATLQYFIRPLQTFEQFRDQVVGLVETAADYGTRLVVFPEYFTLQLLTLADVRQPLSEQIRRLAVQEQPFASLMADLASRHGLYIVAGTIPHIDAAGAVTNVCHVFGPDGRHGVQPKLHMTRFEREWNVVPGSGVNVFETSFGRMAVAICYDVEFPEFARAAARSGAHVLVVPSCTDDRQGFLRVRYCAQARAIDGVECGVLLTPAKRGGTRVSLRSKGRLIDAGAVCAGLGGGGHVGAAGCTIAAPLPDTRKLVEAALVEALARAKAKAG